MSRVCVTGIGIISPIGNSAAENLRALREGVTGISGLDLLQSRYSDSLCFGEIKISNSDLKESLNIKDRGVTRTSLLAYKAVLEAVEDSRLSDKDLSSYDTALIGANTVGGMTRTEEICRDTRNSSEGTDYLGSYDCGSVTLFLQDKLKVKGFLSTINTACSSSANSIMYGARLIRHGFARKAIVGGSDCLAKFTINGFNSLRILSSDKCRPFDKNRKGLNLGEGAAFLVLEREEDVGDKKVYATLTGYGNRNDAYHPSSLSDEGTGPVGAMSKALETADLKPADISYINAHGTGTENNDIVESRAMITVFGKDLPPFSSTKTNTGHTLGASGAVESVYSIFSLNHQEVYPDTGFQTPIDETALIPQKIYQQKCIKHVMTNSFGFGGNCSSLIFSQV